MIILLTGDFCTGKDTVADIMCELSPEHTHKILSYTTRSPRNKDDLNNHKFCNKKQFKKWNDWIATTEINNEYYGARISQFKKDNNVFNIYVVDAKGVNDVLSLDNISHDIVVVEVIRPIWLRDCPDERKNRKKALSEAFPIDYRLFNDGDKNKLIESCKECLLYIKSLQKHHLI